MITRPLLWVGSARQEVRGWPKEARRSAGHQLHLVQQGLDPSDWKPMPSVGMGVREIRIHTRREHRVLYLAKMAEGVYVLHAFEKRTRKASRADIELARQRLRDVLGRRIAGDRTGR